MLKYLRSVIIISLCLILSGSSVAAVYVDADAPGPVYNGKSWATAYKTIQSAIDSINYGGEVWVKTGVYHERVILKHYVNLYGGFRGNETALSQRIIGAYPSIIETGYLARPVEVPANVWCVIDGFRMKYGVAEKGGGIYCGINSNVKIRNCIVDSCWGISFGGGVYFDRYSQGEMSNCVIGYNGSDIGGGIVVEYHSYPKLRNNLIVRNYATKSGGAIYCPYHSGADLEYCTLAFNATLGNGGAAYTYQGGAVKLTNCIIAYNYAPAGGGVFGGGLNSQTYIYNCDIYGNEVENLGGAIQQPPAYMRNFSADPMFIEPSMDNYRLSTGSPCVGVGAVLDPDILP